MKTTSALQKVNFLKPLPSSALHRIMKLAKSQELGKGDFVFKQEEAGAHLFVVLTGMVKIFFTSSSRRRKTLAILQNGDFFGEMALLDGKVRSASAQALKPSKILIIHKNDFKRLLVKDSAMMFTVLRTLSERL